MSWFDGFVHRVRTILDPRGYERELSAEIQHHLDLESMQSRDADQARRRFGNRTYYMEETRRMTWLATLDAVQQDARFAWRSLRRNPSVTMLIIVTLSLGIGVNSATFTLLDRIFLRPPLGVADPGAVHRIWLRYPDHTGERPEYVPSMTYPMYRVIRQTWSDPSGVAVFYPNGDYHIGGTRRGARVDGVFATANYWRVLGVRPQLGRFYTADEDRPGAGAPVIVLSDHLWRTQFGHDSTVLGRRLTLDDQHFTVIGIAPPGFTGTDLRPADAWMPLGATPQPTWMKEPLLSSDAMFVFQLVARAAPNENLAFLDRRATTALRAFSRAAPRPGGDTLAAVTTGPIVFARGPGEQDQSNIISTRLSAVALIVLIIAAANVVNLLLARATRRRREIAVRMALGIGRWRLVRMLTTETLLLALIAAAISILAAWWGGTLLRALLLSDVHFIDTPVDGRVIAFTFMIAILAGTVAGAIPALQASTPDLTHALKEGVREGAYNRSRLRAALLVTQTALSVVLLVGAALFVESLRNVRAANVGYDAPRVIVGNVSFDPGHNPSIAVEAARMEQLARRLEQMPGIQAVARTLNVPTEGYSYTRLWVGTDSVLDPKGGYPVMNVVTQNFFAATGLRLLQGRTLTDLRGAVPQVVINEAMARQLFPRRNAIGSCLRFDGVTGTCYTITGIVETTMLRDVTEQPAPQFYLPMSNLPKSVEKDWKNGTVLLARVSPEAASRAAAAMMQSIRSAFPDGYANVRLLSEVFAPQYRPWKVGATLFTGLSILALVVAVVGIYSTVSYSVTQRTHEFGVRIALGARIGDVLRLVFGEGMRTVVIGVVLGIVLALAAGRLLASLLFGVGPSDPLVMCIVSVVLLVTAAAATLIPAWRGSRVDPMIALRSE